MENSLMFSFLMKKAVIRNLFKIHKGLCLMLVKLKIWEYLEVNSCNDEC